MDKKTWQAKSLFSSSAFSFQKTMTNKPLPPSLLTMMTILKLKHNILFNATKAGDLATVRALRESGVDLFNSRQDDGTSSILVAYINGHIDLLDYLLEQGANPNDQENYGGTCLMAAACYHNPDCVRRLIEAGADVKYVYPGDNASVIYMAASGLKEVEEGNLDFEEGSVVRTVELLLEAGAPGNTPCIDRVTYRTKTALQCLQDMLPFDGKVERERNGLIALLQ
jgi:hypothetical protein